MLTMQLNKGNGIIYSLSRYNDGSREISSISTINKMNNDKYYGIKSAFRFDLKTFENGICIQEVSFIFSGYVLEFIIPALRMEREIVVKMTRILLFNFLWYILVFFAYFVINETDVKKVKKKIF